jgi:hypothetical protein
MQLMLGLRRRVLVLTLNRETRVGGKRLLLRWELRVLLLLLVVEVELLLASCLGLLLEMWITGRVSLVSLRVFNRGLRLVALEKPLH